MQAVQLRSNHHEQCLPSPPVKKASLQIHLRPLLNHNKCIVKNAIGLFAATF